MSTEDPTQQLPSGPDTLPTLERVVARIDRLGALVLQRFNELDVRLNRMESGIEQTHAKLYALRAEWRGSRGVKEAAWP